MSSPSYHVLTLMPSSSCPLPHVWVRGFLVALTLNERRGSVHKVGMVWQFSGRLSSPCLEEHVPSDAFLLLIFTFIIIIIVILLPPSFCLPDLVVFISLFVYLFIFIYFSLFFLFLFLLGGILFFFSHQDIVPPPRNERFP